MLEGRVAGAEENELAAPFEPPPDGGSGGPAAADSSGLAPAVAGDPMGVVVRRLPNGLTILLSPNREEPRIECWITTRAGSAKDPADATGMAHYLEHMPLFADQFGS